MKGSHSSTLPHFNAITFPILSAALVPAEIREKLYSLALSLSITNPRKAANGQRKATESSHEFHE
jgi:hypothetical protein